MREARSEKEDFFSGQLYCISKAKNGKVFLMLRRPRLSLGCFHSQAGRVLQTLNSRAVLPVWDWAECLSVFIKPLVWTREIMVFSFNFYACYCERMLTSSVLSNIWLDQE